MFWFASVESEPSASVCATLGNPTQIAFLAQDQCKCQNPKQEIINGFIFGKGEIGISFAYHLHMVTRGMRKDAKFGS